MRSLRQKLLLSYALLVAGVLAGGAWSIYHFGSLGHSVRLIMSNNYRSVLDAQNMKEALERQDSALMFHVAGHDQKALPQYAENRRQFQRNYLDAADNITEIGEPEAIRDIGQQFEQYGLRAQAFLQSRAPQSEQASLYFAEMEPRFLHLKERCNDLLRLNQDAMRRAQQRAERQAATASRTSIGVSLGLLVFGVLYAVNLSSALVAPLQRLTEAAQRIGEGDLDTHIEVKTGDEVELLAQEFNRMAGRLQDYREREAARLQVAEEKSDAAINSLYEPVLVTGPQGELVDLNRAAEELFGPDSQWRNRSIGELGLASLEAAVHEAVEGRKSVAPEGDGGLIIVSQNGAEGCYRIRTAPILRPVTGDGAGGSVAGTVTVLEDVTRLRQLDRLKDEFISVASHELRTPLTSLQMSVQLLAEGSMGALQPQQERLVRMAVSDAERLERLTKDLLDLTRLEAGTAVPHRQPIRPLDAVDMAMGPLRAKAELKGVALEVRVPPSLPLIYGDVEQLSRVVGNLVDNAIRHTPSKGSVDISAERAGGAVRVTVSDPGPGIPREYLPRVFDRFVQVPGASAGGAGLGLPIARKIVEAHGGAIGVESAPGEGARFHFTVPLSQPEGSGERGREP
jgi:NtrC-family two-component system sensor histidine kinase KinB